MKNVIFKEVYVNKNKVLFLFIMDITANSPTYLTQCFVTCVPNMFLTSFKHVVTLRQAVGSAANCQKQGHFQ